MASNLSKTSPSMPRKTANETALRKFRLFYSHGHHLVVADRKYILWIKLFIYWGSRIKSLSGEHDHRTYIQTYLQIGMSICFPNRRGNKGRDGADLPQTAGQVRLVTEKYLSWIRTLVPEKDVSRSYHHCLSSIKKFNSDWISQTADINKCIQIKLKRNSDAMMQTKSVIPFPPANKILLPIHRNEHEHPPTPLEVWIREVYEASSSILGAR